MSRKLARLVPVVLVAAAAAIGYSPAEADLLTSSINIRGIVPTICNVRFGGAIANVQGNAIDLGLMTQMCNDAAGYKVVLHTPSGLSNATFVYGAMRVPLSESGETVIIDTNAPNFSHGHAEIQLGEETLPQNFALRIQAEPKGTIY